MKNIDEKREMINGICFLITTILVWTAAITFLLMVISLCAKLLFSVLF